MIIKNVEIINHDETIHGDVLVNEKTGFIQDINNNLTLKFPNEKTLDGNGLKLLPGFIDMHTHGCANFDFNGLAKGFNQPLYNKMINQMAKEGITNFFATTVTCSIRNLELINNTLSLFDNKEHQLLGWYIEGPFIAESKKGAHQADLIREYDATVIAKIAKCNPNLIINVAIAPEIITNLEAIKNNKLNNVCFSIGHSDATAEQCHEAYLAGARNIVHLYNQTSAFSHKKPGIVNEAFANHGFNCELISDTVHVKPFTMKNTYDIIGADRISIVSDSLPCKGMPNGEYKLGSLQIDKRDEACYLKGTNTLAGSILAYNKEALKVKEITNCSWNELVKMTSYNQAKLFKFNDLGSVKTNYRANLVLVDSNLNVKLTMVNGKILFSNI